MKLELSNKYKSPSKWDTVCMPNGSTGIIIRNRSKGGVETITIKQLKSNQSLGRLSFLWLKITVWIQDFWK